MLLVLLSIKVNMPLKYLWSSISLYLWLI